MTRDGVVVDTAILIEHVAVRLNRGFHLYFKPRKILSQSILDLVVYLV